MNTSPKIQASTVTSEIRPVPDPTVLTTQQIYTAIAALRDVMEVRLSAMDKAVQLLQEAANRRPTIGELEEQVEGRFRRIDTIFEERAVQSAALTAANLLAVQAALQAQKESLLAQKEAAAETLKSSGIAIAKAEVATNDSLRQLQTLFQTSMGALGTQLQDLKSRLDRGEGDHAGQREARGTDRTNHLDSRALVFSIVASVTALGIVLVGLLNFAKLH